MEPVDASFDQVVFIAAYTLPSETGLGLDFFDVKGVRDMGFLYVVDAEKLVVVKYTWNSFD